MTNGPPNRVLRLLEKDVRGGILLGQDDLEQSKQLHTIIALGHALANLPDIGPIYERFRREVGDTPNGQQQIMFGLLAQMVLTQQEVRALRASADKQLKAETTPPPAEGDQAHG